MLDSHCSNNELTRAALRALPVVISLCLQHEGQCIPPKDEAPCKQTPTLQQHSTS